MNVETQTRVFLAGAPAWIGMKTGYCTSIVDPLVRAGPPGPAVAH